MKSASLFLFLFLTLASCSGNNILRENHITVSIAPLQYIIEEIAGNSYEISVLVPGGSSPENYEPTPSQLRLVERSVAFFYTGLLDFEIELINKISSAGSDRFYNCSQDVDLIGGHFHGEQFHGNDPHIWLSPSTLTVISAKIASQLIKINPSDSLMITQNLNNLLKRLNTLEQYICEALETAGIDKFIIYHPSLSYYSRDFGLVQIAIENHGKEPSAEYMKRIVDIARDAGLDRIIYQTEFGEQVVTSLGKEIGAELIPFDPVEKNVFSNLEYITDRLTR